MSFVKGTTLQPRVRFVKSKYGEDGWKKVLGLLPESDRKVLGGIILASIWYSSGLYERLNGAINRCFGDRDGSIIREIGKQNARDTLSKTYNQFIRNGPEALVRALPNLFRIFCMDVGEVEVEVKGEGEALYSVVSDNRWLLKSVEGYLEEGLLMAGASSSSVTMFEEGETKVYEVKWS